MRWELRQFQKELGVTTVHVTHDQREAMSLADRVVLMQSGKIVQAGPPAALFDDPVDRFAAAFIGSPSMNFLPLRLTADGLALESAPTLQISSPPGFLDRVRARRIDQVVMGIRPHFVDLKAGVASSTQRLAGQTASCNPDRPRRPRRLRRRRPDHQGRAVGRDWTSGATPPCASLQNIASFSGRTDRVSDDGHDADRRRNPGSAQALRRASRRSRRSISRCARERCSASSVRPERARPRRSDASRACTSQTPGTIRLDGVDVTHVSPMERDIAVVFEGFNLLPTLSVFDNIAFPLRSPLYRAPEDEVKARVMRAAGDLRIAGLLDRHTDEISGGERQRVALARALVRRPKLFLLDEPLASLDLKLREALENELRDMQRERGQTLIYASHDFLGHGGDRVAHRGHRQWTSVADRNANRNLRGPVSSSSGRIDRQSRHGLARRYGPRRRAGDRRISHSVAAFGG